MSPTATAPEVTIARTVAQLGRRCACGHTMAGHTHRAALDGSTGCVSCVCPITGRTRAEIEAAAITYVGIESKLSELRAEWRLAS